MNQAFDVFTFVLAAAEMVAQVVLCCLFSYAYVKKPAFKGFLLLAISFGLAIYGYAYQYFVYYDRTHAIRLVTDHRWILNAVFVIHPFALVFLVSGATLLIKEVMNSKGETREVNTNHFVFCRCLCPFTNGRLQMKERPRFGLWMLIGYLLPTLPAVLYTAFRPTKAIAVIHLAAIGLTCPWSVIAYRFSHGAVGESHFLSTCVLFTGCAANALGLFAIGAVLGRIFQQAQSKTSLCLHLARFVLACFIIVAGLWLSLTRSEPYINAVILGGIITLAGICLLRPFRGLHFRKETT